MNKKLFTYYIWIIVIPLLCLFGVSYILSLKIISTGEEFILSALPYFIFIYISLAIERSPLKWVVNIVEKNRDKLNALFDGSIKLGIATTLILFLLMEPVLGGFGYIKKEKRGTINPVSGSSSYYYIKINPEEKKRNLYREKIMWEEIDKKLQKKLLKH